MMVRKPVAQNRSLPGAAPAVPYPTTPTSLGQGQKNTEGPFGDTDLEGLIVRGSHGDGYLDLNKASNPWQGNPERILDKELPPLLEVGGGRIYTRNGREEGLPLVLQPGSAEATPRSSWESERLMDPTLNTFPASTQPPNQVAPEPPQAAQSTNPYHRLHSSNGKAPERAGEESGADVWGNGQPAPQLPHDHPPTKSAFAEPWMKFDTSPVEQGVSGTEETPKVAHNGGTSDFSLEQNSDFADHRAAEAPIPDVQSPHSYGAQTQHFDDVGHPPANPTSIHSLESPLLNNTVNQVPVGVPNDITESPIQNLHNRDAGPALPPRILRRNYEDPLVQPPRPPKPNDVEISEAADAQLQRGESVKTKRARETYQIRHVNWYDASSPTNPRRSPIMVQNANGPCPLLALVNALVLSTPADYATALVETLRVREQVSLGLLLDAVIDELIGRNGDLPDVSDMYSFLVTLHTGMNVNPRFVPIDAAVNLMDAPIKGDLPTNLHESRKAGGFENTWEMKLYSTFAIPLIHGWIPPRNHPATAALKRTARTYEDAQNLMFREEELEEKLQLQGLSPEEQMTLEDVASVKYFLSSTATQLTGYGLDSMTETMIPGSIAILFRNDHFSTLYRHPKSGQLLTLVTDMGYAGHDDVVWESLVDVSGEGCEFFSGDFRPVGNVAGDTQPPPSAQEEAGWATVNNRNRRPARSDRKPSHSNLPPLSTLNLTDNATPLSPNTEQEDHDLALAMQLQEEEEERDRQEAAARRREDELSQAYLNSSDASGRRTFPGFSSGATGAQGGPSPPPRSRGSGRGAPPGRPAPPRKSIDTEDAPPPTYEQAAKGPAYHPPSHHPAHPDASPIPGTRTPRAPPTRPRQSSAYSEHAAAYGPSSPSPYGPPRRGHASRASGSGAIRGGGGVDPALVRRRSGAPGSAVSLEEERKEKDCVVM